MQKSLTMPFDLTLHRDSTVNNKQAAAAAAVIPMGNLDKQSQRLQASSSELFSRA